MFLTEVYILFNLLYILLNYYIEIYYTIDYYLFSINFVSFKKICSLLFVFFVENYILFPNYFEISHA